MGGETEGLILLFCSLECSNCRWVGGGGLGRKFYLGSAEISSFVYLVQFKDGGRSLSLRLNLFFLM